MPLNGLWSSLAAKAPIKLLKPKIIIGSDHAGYRMKRFLIDRLRKEGYTIDDKGPYDESSVDAGIFVVEVGETVAASNGDALGIISEHMAWEFAKVWLKTNHVGGKYVERVQRMMEYEQKC